MDSFWHMLLETTKHLYNQESNEIQQSQSPTWSTPRNINKTTTTTTNNNRRNHFLTTSPTVDGNLMGLAPPRWQSSPQHQMRTTPLPTRSTLSTTTSPSPATSASALQLPLLLHNNNSSATSSAATDSGAVLSSQQESSGFDELDSNNAIISTNRQSFDPLHDLLSICLAASVNLSNSTVLSPPLPPPPPTAAAAASPLAVVSSSSAPVSNYSPVGVGVGASHLPTLPEETTSELELHWFEMMQQQQLQQQQQQQQRKCDRRRYKTELCRKFSLTGDCEYADKCQYAHGWNELRASSRHPRYKTQLCVTFHTSGLCPYGQRCDFIHNENENSLREIRLQIQLYNQYKRFFPNEQEIPMEKIQALVKTITISESRQQQQQQPQQQKHQHH